MARYNNNREVGTAVILVEQISVLYSFKNDVPCHFNFSRTNEKGVGIRAGSTKASKNYKRGGGAIILFSKVHQMT